MTDYRIKQMDTPEDNLPSLAPIDINRSVGGLTFPMAFATGDVGGFAKFITIMPGLMDFNGNAENANIGIRIYEPFGNMQGWLPSGYTIPSTAMVLGRLPAYRQDTIPWFRPVNMIVEFFLVSGIAVPASGASIGLVILPWNP